MSTTVSVPSVGKRDKRKEKLVEPGLGKTKEEHILEA
jgi:hypothetical protein